MGWLAIVKAVLPHAGTIVNLATPVFTNLKNKEEAVQHPVLLEQQIEELQGAVLQNAEHIKELAEQVQSTAKALEQAMLAAEEKVNRAYTYCVVAIGLALLSSGIALFALFTR
jgi:uncharacterized protein YlxW (UPF0749 family)